MNHVSPLASDLGQAVHTSLLLAQLGKARAGQRLLKDRWPSDHGIAPPP